MNLELDHAFILVEPNAEVADLLLSLDIEESFGKDHKGQGTSNRRFEFSNGMLEFLWVRDAEEAVNGPGKDLRFPERAGDKTYSPFGVLLHRKSNSQLAMPFAGWQYQPDYFKPPMAFHVGVNSSDLDAPLCMYVPFVEPIKRTLEKGTLEKRTFKSISNVTIHTTANKLSDVLAVANKADRLTITCANEHLMEITFDQHQLGLSKDLRPVIPLIIHW